MIIANIAPCSVSDHLQQTSLEVQLGAKAKISKTDALLDSIPEGAYSLKLIDVSGATWKQDFRIK